MFFREVVGLILLIAGAAIAPLGWMLNNALLPLSLVLLTAGVVLFYTERRIKKERELEKEGSANANLRPAMPGDVHNYTGWRTGGRRESLSESLNSDTSEADYSLISG